MKILHICSYFHTSKVHLNLFKALIPISEFQYIFVPFNPRYCEQRNCLDRETVKVMESSCFKPWMKVSLFLKVLVGLISFYKLYNPSKPVRVNIIHSHSFFVDGLIGLFISKIYHIPHVVTVRNTDLNAYLKYFVHLRFIARIILKHSHVIFLSKTTHSRFSKIVKAKFSYTIQPNGVDHKWLENRSTENINRLRDPNDCVSVISVGYFDKNKNFGNALRATSLIKVQRPLIHTFIGGSKSDFLSVYGNEFDFSDTIFLGKIADMSVLRKFIRESDIMLMPSFSESFGLVYIEGLSQNCKIICSNGEGIDGVFDDDSEWVSYCDPSDVHSISDSVLSFLKVNLIEPSPLNLDEFSWDSIASNFVNKVYFKMDSKNE